MFLASLSVFSAIALAQTPDFNALLTDATRHQAEVSEKLKSEIAKGEGYDICVHRELSLQNENDQWFISHFHRLKKISEIYDFSISNLNQKLKEIGNNPITLNMLEGQKTAPKISIFTAIEFMRFLNQRLSTCVQNGEKSLVEDTITQMNSPKSNPFEIGYEQVVQALDRISRNANQALKDDTAFIEFVTVKKSYFEFDLMLRIKLEGQTIYERSLLKTNLSELSNEPITQKEKWLAFARVKLDGLSVDAMTRYQELYQKHKIVRCRDKTSMPIVSVLQTLSVGTPYLPIAELSQKPVTEIKSDEEVKSNTWVIVPYPGGEFEMQATEVTEKQFYGVNNELSYLPVKGISYGSVRRYLKRLSKQDPNYDYRLPSLSEWLFAARGNESISTYAFGEDRSLLPLYAHFDQHTGLPLERAPVGRKLPNTFGLYDMHGNVAEWTSSYRTEAYGGSYYDVDVGLSLNDYRTVLDPPNGDQYVGFRPVRVPKKKK